MELIKQEDGYGTVEMLVIIAGVGLIATAIFKSLDTSLANGPNSAVDKVGTNVDTMLKGWFIEE